jgi:lipopolysaccharide export system permease protein
VKRTLSAYLVSEIIPPFLIGLLAFTFILLIAKLLKLVELVVTRGVSLVQIGKLLSLILPTFLEMTVPMAFFLGILFGLSRLSSDQEVLALKASGISPGQILLPIVIVALVISSITLMITTWGRPAANLALRKELYDIAKTRIVTAFREKVFNDPFPKVLIYFDEVIPPGDTSQGVVIVDRRDAAMENIIFAKAAFFVSHEETQSLSFKLFDGTLYEKKRNRSGFSHTHFNVYDFHLDIDEAFNLARKKERAVDEMSIRRLRNAIVRKRESGIEPTAELMEFHQRLSFPFTPLLFSLLGVGLVMRPTPSRTSRAGGFSLCLFWLLVYYAILSAGKALGERELISPALALWLPNILVGFIAIRSFKKALTESPAWIQTKLEKLFAALSHGRAGMRQERP